MSFADKIAVALLAAGASTRFGGNKLETDFGGKMLGLAAAETIASMGFDWQFAICGPNSARLVEPLGALGFAVIYNDTPEAGLSHSLRLAVKAAEATQATALLVCLADMPYVTTAHLQALVDSFHATGAATASTSESQSKPPALFPRAFWMVLKATTGDRGAKDLLESAIQIEAQAAILADIDLLSDLSNSSGQSPGQSGERVDEA